MRYAPSYRSLIESQAAQRTRSAARQGEQTCLPSKRQASPCALPLITLPLFPDAQRLWSAEIHLRCQVAPGLYRAGCLISCAVKVMSDWKAELKLIRQSRTSPAGSALQGGRAIFWRDAGE